MDLMKAGEVDISKIVTERGYYPENNLVMSQYFDVNGFRRPVLALNEGHKDYKAITGIGRLKAAKDLGKFVPVVEVSLTDEEAQSLNFTENMEWYSMYYSEKEGEL